MNKKYAIAGVGAATALAIPAALLVASPAQADSDRTIRCGGAEIELSVDKEFGVFEIDGSIDNAKPGSKWRVALRHEGKVYYKAVRTADREGEIDVERIRKNTAGKDTFSLAVRNLSTNQYCTTKIVTR